MSMPQLPAIRRATPDDADTVSALATRTFVETFGHLYPAEDLQAFLANAYAVEKQRVILSHPGYAVWLLECDGTAIGHAAAGPCGLPHPDVAPGDGELRSEEHTSELQSLMRISSAVFCLKKKNHTLNTPTEHVINK